MSKRSEASLTVVPSGLPARLPPPADLTPDQTLRWRAVVDSKPNDWFGPDSAALLKEYVRAEAMCDLLAEKIEAATTAADAAVIKTFLDMRDKESRRLTSVATKLRLTQQSRYTPQAASTANSRSGSSAVWEYGKKS